MRIYMKNKKSIKINREIATFIWGHIKEHPDEKFFQLNDIDTKETCLVVAIQDISHIS